MESAHYKATAIKQGVDAETLVRRPLSHTEFDAMNEAEKNWHLSENSKAVDAAFAANEKEVRKGRTLSKAAVAKLYANESETPEVDRDNTIHNFKVFLASYPQYINLPIQAATILTWLRDKSLYPEVENIVRAFKTLGRDGKLKIDPSQTGLVDETELTGTALEFHPQVNRLLEAVTPEVAESRRVMRMDPKSKEFQTWEQENLGPKQLPPMIKVRIDQAFATFASMCPEFIFNDANKTKLLAYLNEHYTNIDYNTIKLAYEALKRAGQLDINENVVVRGEYGTITDYSQVEQNKHLTDRQETLKYKIKTMTSEQYDAWIQNPANRRAADNLR